MTGKLLLHVHVHVCMAIPGSIYGHALTCRSRDIVKGRDRTRNETPLGDFFPGSVICAHYRERERKRGPDSLLRTIRMDPPESGTATVVVVDIILYFYRSRSILAILILVKTHAAPITRLKPGSCFEHYTMNLVASIYLGHGSMIRRRPSLLRIHMSRDFQLPAYIFLFAFFFLFSPS